MGRKHTGFFAYITLLFYVSSLSPVLYSQPMEPEAPSLPFSAYSGKGAEEVFTYEVTPDEEAHVVYGDVELFIPAGAVEENTTLSIEKLDGVKRLNEGMNNVTRNAAGYRFGPHPYRFKKNIRVTLPYDNDVNSSEASLSDLKMWFYNEEHNSWEGLPMENVDKDRSVVTGITNHFTDMITSTLTLPESPGPINFDPNSIKELEAANPVSLVPQVKGLEPGAMGGASFSIPFRLPGGRGKATPQLALNYNLNSANSWLGRGFDISVPSITTDTRFGLPDYDGYDTYMLEGQELILDSSLDTDTYKQYKLRNEGSFQRIERYILDNEDRWEVTSKDGTVRTFGTGYAWSGKNRGNVFTWYLKSIVDSNGNRVDYGFTQQDGYTYPESISWTGYDGEDAPYKVLFIRETRGDARSEARGKYMSRLSMRLASLDIQYYGETFRSYQFKYRYNLFGQSELIAYEEQDGEGNCAYRYEFGFEELEEKNDGYQGFEEELETWGKDENTAGGGFIDESLSESHTISGGASVYTGVSIKIWWPKIWGLRKKTLANFGISAGGGYSRLWDSSSLMDVDGNGLPDLTWQSGNSLHFYPNTGSNLSSENESHSGASYVMNEGDQVSFNIGVSGGAGGLSASYSKDYSWSYGISTFSDINGDGLIDMVKKDNGVYRQNTGSSFTTQPWGAISSFSSEETDETIARKADFDRGYYIEEPVKKWKAWKPGIVRVVNNIELAQEKLRSEEGVQAILDYPDRDENEDPVILSINSDSITTKEDLVDVEKDDPLYFVLDTMGEIKDESAEDNSDCFADDVMWNTKISYEEIELFHDVRDREPYYFFDDKISISEYNILPDFLEDYYEKEYDSSNEKDYGKLRGGSSSRFNNENPATKKKIRDWQYDNNLFIPRVIPHATFDEIFAYFDQNIYVTYKTILLTLYMYDNVTDNFVLQSLILPSYLKRAFALVLPELSASRKSELGHYYLLDRRMDWSYDTVPKSEFSANSKFENQNLVEAIDASVDELGTSTTDGILLVDRTTAEDVTLYTILDRNNGTVSLSTNSGIIEDDITVTVSGSSYSFEYEGIDRTYSLSYHSYPDIIPENCYENKILPLILADENIGSSPIGKLKADYLEGYLAALDRQIAAVQAQIDETDPVPTEEELIALNREKESYEDEKRVYTDNYTLSTSEATYILNSSVSNADFQFFIETFRDDFTSVDDSELYQFSGSPDSSSLFLVFLTSDNKKSFETYCGLTDSDLILLDDGTWTVRPALANGLQSALKIYRAMEELFPYYTDEGSSYIVKTLSNDDEAKVSALMAEANLKVASGLTRKYTYQTTDSYPVYHRTLTAEQAVLPINSMDGSIIIGEENEIYSYVKFLSFNSDGESMAERIYFPQFDTQKDFSIHQWPNISESDYNLGTTESVNQSLNAEVKDALTKYVGDYNNEDNDPFGGGFRNWYYGFWSAFYDWNSENIGKDPDPDKDYGKVVDEDGSELDVETELPQFFVGASYNQYEENFLEGIDEKPLGENVWMGSVSSYSTSYVSLNSSGMAEPVYREYEFAPYFSDDGRWHPMRKGGLQYYTSPVVQPSTTGGGSSLGEFRESRTEGSSVTGGVTLVVGISGGKGDSDTYTTRNLMDMNGDRLPDLIKLDNGDAVSVKLGTGSGFGATDYFENSFSYLNSSNSESYNFGASMAPGGQETVRDADGGPLFEMVKPPSDPESIDSSGMGVGGSVSLNGGYSTTQANIDIMDMNGDGLPDHISRDGRGSLNIKYNSGSSFTSGADNWPTSFQSGLSETVSGSFGVSGGLSKGYLGMSASISGSNNKTEYQLLDINGDGLSDQVEKLDNTDYFKVKFNRGNSFTSETFKIYCPDWNYNDETYKAQLESDINTLKKSSDTFGGLGLDVDKITDTSAIFDSSENQFSDIFDVSGITDTLTSSNGISFSLGASYNFAIQIIPPDLLVFDITPGINGSLASSTSNIRMADMNGSGAPDHVLKAPGRDYLLLRINKMASVGQLKQIFLPQGGSYSLEYGRSTNSTMDPHSRWYLTAVEKNDGYEDSDDDENVHTYRTEFSYGEGMYDRNLREFFGFDMVKIKSGFIQEDGKWIHRGNTVEKHYDNNDYYCKGVETQTIVLDSDGNNVNQVDKEYIQDPQLTASLTSSTTANRYSALSGNNYYSVFYKLKSQTTTMTDPTTGKSIVKNESYTYDDLGNITQLVSEIEGAPESQNYLLKIGYYQNIDRYITNLPNSLEAYWGKSPATSASRLLRKRTADYDTQGNLTSLNQWYGPGTTDFNTIYLTYDDKYGNLLTVTDPLGYQLAYVYGYGNRFVTQVTAFNTSDPLDSFVSKMDWDPKLGVETEQTEVNGNSMTKEYDSFGRLTEIRTDYDSEDSNDTPAVSYDYFTESFPWRAVTSNKVSFNQSNGETIETLMTIDGLGRVTQTAKEGVITNENGTKSRGWNCSGAIYYDEKARKVMEGQPQFDAIEYSLPLTEAGFPRASGMENGTVTYYDSLDRVTQVDLPPDENGKIVSMYTQYTVDNVSLTGASPISGSSENHQGTIQIDPLGNVTEVWKNGRGHIAAIVKKDDKGDKGETLTEMSYEYNLLGELLTTSDYLGNSVFFEYDLLGRTVRQESPDAGVQEFIYNTKGQLTTKRDSNLTALGKSIGYTYDNHNRIIEVDYPYSEDVIYEYGTNKNLNNKGRLIKVSNGSGSTEYEYGLLGEVIKVTRTINRLKPGTSAESTSISYQSDYLGRMETITFNDDGEVLTYGYDEGGQIVSATGERLGKDYEYVKDIGYDKYGQRVYMEYGDGTETWYTYDETRRWLDSLITTRIDSGQVYQNIHYTFDDVGNITQTDNSGTYHHDTVQTYTYDGLYQLESATGNYKLHLNNNTVTGKSQYTQSFTYDKIGNMLTKVSTESKYPNVSVSALNYTNAYSYYTDAPHRAEIIGDMYYKYDNNGNVIEERQGGHREETVGGTFSYTYPDTDITRASQAFGWDRGGETEPDSTYRREYTWDEENRLTGTSDPSYTTVYTYDHEGERTVKYSDLGETLYFDSMWLEADTEGTGRLRCTKNIYIGETRIASKLNYKGEGTDYEDIHTYYYHTDHLSSSNVVTDADGEVYEHMEYTPYGEKWILDQNDNSKYDMIPYRFTAKEYDEETGLYYMSARYQNPEAGRWVSSDPAGFQLIKAMEQDRDGTYKLRSQFSIIESMNPYSYCENNPVRYTDPTGMWTNDMGKAVYNNLNEDYISGTNDCDAWLESVVKEADSSSTLSDDWGSAASTNAAGHKSKLKEKGSLKSILTLGSNVAIQKGKHVMLVSLNPDGSVDVAHNTSNPENKEGLKEKPGGFSETFSYDSEQEFLDDGWGELLFYSLGDGEDFKEGVYSNNPDESTISSGEHQKKTVEE